MQDTFVGDFHLSGIYLKGEVVAISEVLRKRDEVGRATSKRTGSPRPPALDPLNCSRYKRTPVTSRAVNYKRH